MRTTAKLPRAVFVARARMSVPARPDDERKYELHGRHIRTVIVCPATRAGITKPGGATVVGLPPLRTPVLGTALFYSVAPIVALATRRRSSANCDRVPESLRGLRSPRPEEVACRGDFDRRCRSSSMATGAPLPDSTEARVAASSPARPTGSGSGHCVTRTACDR